MKSEKAKDELTSIMKNLVFGFSVLVVAISFLSLVVSAIFLSLIHPEQAVTFIGYLTAHTILFLGIFIPTAWVLYTQVFKFTKDIEEKEDK